ITISGGTIIATGGEQAAGIGGGCFATSCGTITIQNTVTRVTATKGDSAPNSIGAGDYGSCGTVKIGGVTGAISTSPYTYEPIPQGALSGKFTINGSGDKVRFSQGNLQATYDGSSWSWAFATNQWDYIGRAEGNTKVSGSTPFVSGYSGTSTTVDLFGWSTSATTYGIHNSESNSTYSGDFVDWGNTIGSGWRTLSSAEWTYLFNTRTSGSTVNGTSNARYTHATINTDGTGVNGIILFPDGVTIANGEATSWGTVNGDSGDSFWNNATKCTAAQWTALAAKGCVFLPAAGYRSGSSVFQAGSDGSYWSSTPYSTDKAYFVNSGSNYLYPDAKNNRYTGRPVRLVRVAN
ncbi:MAG: hypothetical protein J5671_03390, partial [Bacteroidaceae bacterium]|nr:hypothetical protein [Bacteroidaceae bacterium]